MTESIWAFVDAVAPWAVAGLVLGLTAIELRLRRRPSKPDPLRQLSNEDLAQALWELDRRAQQGMPAAVELQRYIRELERRLQAARRAYVEQVRRGAVQRSEQDWALLMSVLPAGSMESTRRIV